MTRISRVIRVIRGQVSLFLGVVREEMSNSSLFPKFGTNIRAQFTITGRGSGSDSSGHPETTKVYGKSLRLSVGPRPGRLSGPDDGEFF